MKARQSVVGKRFGSNHRHTMGNAICLSLDQNDFTAPQIGNSTRYGHQIGRGNIGF